MSDETIKIPNEVGQMDEVVEAIREGDAGKMFGLLDAEIERRAVCCKQTRGEALHARAGRNKVSEFRNLIAANANAWNAARRACGWNPDEPAEAKPAVAGVMRVEELRVGDAMQSSGEYWVLREMPDEKGQSVWTFMVDGFEDRASFNTTTYLQERLSRGAEVFRRDREGNRIRISGWPAGEHPAVAEVEKLAKELEEARADNETLRTDLSWDNLSSTKIEAANRENEQLKSKLASWVNAANHNPNGTPLAKPATEPEHLIERIDGMTAASKELQSQLENPKVCCHRIASTLHAYYTEQLSRKGCPGFTRAANLVLLAIETLYTGVPAAKPYEIATNFWREPK